MRSILASFAVALPVAPIACGSPAESEPDVAASESALWGVCRPPPVETAVPECGPFTFRLPWTAGIRRNVRQTESTEPTHKRGTKDAYAFDFRIRACESYLWTPLAPEELEVRAVADGIVVDTRFDRYEVAGPSNTNFVLVEHALPGGGTVQSLYAHLKMEEEAPVKIGDAIARGAYLGRMGRSGTWEAHLHFQFQRVPSVEDRRRDCDGDYPFCQSVSYLDVNPCGFEEAPRLRFDNDYLSTNAPPLPGAR